MVTPAFYQRTALNAKAKRPRLQPEPFGADDVNHRRTTTKRRHGARDPLPLFAWAARHMPLATTGPRLILRDDLRDAEGAPRACLAIPGRRLPLAFPNIGAALAALHAMESAR